MNDQTRKYIASLSLDSKNQVFKHPEGSSVSCMEFGRRHWMTCHTKSKRRRDKIACGAKIARKLIKQGYWVFKRSGMYKSPHA